MASISKINLRSGVSQTDGTDTAATLKQIQINTSIFATNSDVLKKMASDMNVTKLNIMKMVTLMGGGKAASKPERGFAKDVSEKNYKKQAKATDAAKQLTTEKSSSMLGGLGENLAKMAEKAGNLTAIGVGIGGFLAGVGAGLWALTAMGGTDGLKNTLVALAEGLNAFSVQSLLALGAVGAAGGLAAAVGKGTEAAIGAGGMLAAFGVGLGGFIAGISLGVFTAQEFKLGSPEAMSAWLKALATGLNEFNPTSLAALGAVALMGAVGVSSASGFTGKLGVVLGAGGMLASFGLGLGGFIAGLALGVEGAAAISSPDTLTLWLVALAEGLNAFDASSLSALGAVVATGAVSGGLAGIPGVGTQAAIGAVLGAGGMLASVGLGMGLFILALGLGTSVADKIGSPEILESWLTSLARGLNAITEVSFTGLAGVGLGLYALGPAMIVFFGVKGLMAVGEFIGEAWGKIKGWFGGEKKQEKSLFEKIAEQVKPLETMDTAKLQSAGEGLKGITESLVKLASLKNDELVSVMNNGEAVISILSRFAISGGAIGRPGAAPGGTGGDTTQPISVPGVSGTPGTAPSPPAGSGRSGTTQPTESGGMATLLTFISKGEGGYNSMNQGTRGGRIVGSTHDASTILGKKLTDMTVGEIMEHQAQGRLFAAGRYQIIPQTMKGIVKKAGVSENDLFDAKTQDKLGVALIMNRPRLAAYIKGKSDDIHAAMKDFAMEWASMPDPDTGNSYYGSGNRALHTVAEVRGALMGTRGAAPAGGDTQLAKSTPTPVPAAVAASSSPPPSPPASSAAPSPMPSSPSTGTTVAAATNEVREGEKEVQANNRSTNNTIISPKTNTVNAKIAEKEDKQVDWERKMYENAIYA